MTRSYSLTCKHKGSTDSQRYSRRDLEICGAPEARRFEGADADDRAEGARTRGGGRAERSTAAHLPQTAERESCGLRTLAARVAEKPASFGGNDRAPA